MIHIENGYYATAEGKIYSSRSNRVLRGGTGTNGRPMITMLSDGKFRTRFIHVLVCEAYHGKRPSGMEVSHIDGNMLNNRPENLCWETRSENLRRRSQHGTDDKGFRNSRACLTPESLVNILVWRGQGLTQQVIATRLGISRTTVSRVLNGQRYGGDAQ